MRASGMADTDDAEWRSLLEIGWKRAGTEDATAEQELGTELELEEALATQETVAAPAPPTAPSSLASLTSAAGSAPGSLMARLLRRYEPSEDLPEDVQPNSSEDPSPPSLAMAPSCPPARSSREAKSHPKEEDAPARTNEDADAAWRRHLEQLWSRSIDSGDKSQEEQQEEQQEKAADGEANGFVEIDDVGDEELLAAEEASAEAARETKLESEAMAAQIAEVQDQPDPEVVDLEALDDDEIEQWANRGCFKGGARRPPKVASNSSKLRTFSVTNTVNATTPGLAYRNSKDSDDKDLGQIVKWGSTVSGIDEGDGWLRVPRDDGDRFLPFTRGGKAVLSVRVPLARTTSATLYGNVNGHSTSPKEAGRVKKVATPPKDPPPAWLTKNAWSGPRPAGAGKRPHATINGDQYGPDAKRGRMQPGCDLAACDADGRPYNLREVVVNFANVGASYGKKVLGKRSDLGQRIFDWEGVRLACKHLRLELGMNIIGVIFENFWGADKGCEERTMPQDIIALCDSIEETPRLTGLNQKSADDEMTIKCAWRRNCRFMDNDNYRDWKRELRNEKCRQWLEKTQDFLQMRYYFDSRLGSFDTLDGNIPSGILASGFAAQPQARHWEGRAAIRPGASW